MAKIVYTPLPVWALTLAGAHFLSLADAGLNMGTGDFGAGILCEIATDTPDTWIYLCGKGPLGAALQNASGWHIYAHKTLRKLQLQINDGKPAVTYIDSAEGVFALGADFLAWLAADRSGEARWHVNGADVGGGDIHLLTGSLDNSEAFRVGGESASASRLKGSISFLRLDQGRALPAEWHAEEWDRLRYGYPRKNLKFLETWDFAQTLVGLSAAAHTLSWQGGGSAAYETGYPSSAAPLSLFFYPDMRYGDPLAPEENQTWDRAEDGTLRSYRGFDLKQKITLPGEAFTHAQMIGLRAAYESGEAFDLYLEDDKPPLGDEGMMFSSPPEFTEHQELPGYWEGSLEMVEI